MKKLLKIIIVILVFLFIFFAINFFRGGQYCFGQTPVDADGNGVPENCLVSE